MKAFHVRTSLFAILALHLFAAGGQAAPASGVSDEQACHLFASTVLLDARDQGNRQAWLQQCNANKQECQSIIGFIKQNNDGKSPPELTCVGDSRPSLDRPRMLEISGDATCDRVAAVILTGELDNGNLSNWIRQCNANKPACERARGFILQNNDGQVPAQLTCR